MLLKFRIPLIAFLLSVLGERIGSMLKILHWPGATETLILMIPVQSIAIVWIIGVLAGLRGGTRENG
jgi:hypothetical protein